MEHQRSMLHLALILIVSVSLATSTYPTCPKGCRCAPASDKDYYNAKCDGLDTIAKMTNYDRKQTIRMQNLDLTSTNITKFNAEVLKRLINLEELELSHNYIVDITKKIALPKLVYLGLSSNFLSKIPVFAFPSKLHHLDLSRNLIQNLPDDLLTMTHLKTLKIRDNSIQCTCSSWEVFHALLGSNVTIDSDKCLSKNDRKIHSWHYISHSAICSQLEDIMQADEVGSGNGETLDYDNEMEKHVDDLNEFIPVSNEAKKATTKPPNTVSTTNSELTNTDFNFDEEIDVANTTPNPNAVLTTTKKSEDSQFEEGSGDSDAFFVEHDSFNITEGSGSPEIIPEIVVTSIRVPTVNEDDDDEGSGVFIPDDTETDLSSTEGGFKFIPDITTEHPEPITTANPYRHEYDNKEEITEAPFIKVEKIDTGAELVPSSDNGSINEVFGQVIETDQKRHPFGTYIFVCVLIAIFICLIGYTVIRRTIRSRNRRNRRNDSDESPNSGTELRDMDKTVALLNQENEKKSNGVTETTPMIPNDSNLESMERTTPVINGYNGNTPPEDNPTELTNGQVATEPSSPREAERVRITLSELTDSVPKTPVLVTRTRSSAGDKIIVTPNLNQRINLHANN